MDPFASARPYYAVIFSSVRRGQDGDGYGDMAQGNRIKMNLLT